MRRVEDWKATKADREAKQLPQATETDTDIDVEVSTPDETDEQRLAREARARKKARKIQRRDAAKISFGTAKRTLAAQAALVRVQLNAGDEHATIAISGSLMKSFIQLGYVSITGALTYGMELDQMAASVRAADLIDSEGLAAVIAALSSDADTSVKAGLYLNAIDVLSLGYEPRQKARRSRRKRILAEGRRFIESFNADPDPDATYLASAQADDDLQPGCSYRVFAERIDDPGTHYRVAKKQFDDSSDGLRSLANQIIGLQKGLPAGYRVRVLSLDPDTLQPVTGGNHSETLEVAGGAQ